MTSTPNSIIFSLVSHGQLRMVKEFLTDFRTRAYGNVSILLTLNIPEDESVLHEFSDLPITVIRNTTRKGFGENHNFAFASSKGDLFFIVNPDIRLGSFDLARVTLLFERSDVGACAPLVLSSLGAVEDSARRFPTLFSLLKRAIFGRNNGDYTLGKSPVDVDWVAGMFVAFRPEAFAEVGGFDEGYFLYYEDADICRRLRRCGWATVIQPATAVIHDAQRASRHSAQHLRWHVESIFRFLFLA